VSPLVELEKTDRRLASDERSGRRHDVDDEASRDAHSSPPTGERLEDERERRRQPRRPMSTWRRRERVIVAAKRASMVADLGAVFATRFRAERK
jgi:hypothetical protein